MPTGPPNISLPRSLRPGRNEHPGNPDMPRPKRPTEEVQAEKAARASQKLTKERNRDQDILDTAHLEKKIRQEYQDKLDSANHPPTNTQNKVLRPRAKDTTASAPPGESPAIQEIRVVTGEFFKEPTGKSSPVTMDISSDSGEEYVPEAEEGEDVDIEEDEEVLDPTDEEDGGKKKGKKKKGSLRKEVQAALGDDALTAAPATKRKAQAAQSKPQLERASKKPKKASAGIHDDWQHRTIEDHQENDIYMSEDLPSIQRSHSASSGMSISSGWPATTPGGDPTDDDEGDMGGISDNAGEGAERSALIGNKSKSKVQPYYGGQSRTTETKVQSLARVIPTTTVPAFIPPSTSAEIANARARKKDIRVTHLPVHLRSDFDAIFAPRLREAFGYTPAWSQPTDEELEKLWRDAFPREPPPGPVVKKLIEDRLATWRNKFGTSALALIRQVIFPGLPNNSKEQRAQWCTWAISGQDHNQPFYYLKYEESEEDGGKVSASGIFQSPLISAVLGTHFSGISPINPKLRSTKRPVGALVHAIQAVKRAIAMWTTGEEVKLRRPWGDYSKANWGDHNETREGKIVPVLTTTNLIRVIEKLKDKQWEKIVSLAVEASKARKETIRAPEEASITGTASAEPFELLDDDSDLVDEGSGAT